MNEIKFKNGNKIEYIEYKTEPNRGKEKIIYFHDMFNLKWYQKLYLNIRYWKTNKEYRKFYKEYNKLSAMHKINMKE